MTPKPSYKVSELQHEVSELKGRVVSAITDYFDSEQGRNDLQRVALESVRPFSKKLASKFPTKKADYKTASQKLISQHFGKWFDPLPDSDLDGDFLGCSDFENYHPPGEPESEDSSAEDEDEDLDEDVDGDLGGQINPTDPSAQVTSPTRANDDPPTSQS